MIISRSPLRISIAGGGTDLPSYFERKGGFVISAAINKYVYVSISKPFSPGITLKYSQIELIKHLNEIKHPIIRESLKHLKLQTPQIEIASVADIPSGTGLGSSGSFTTGLLKALYTHTKKPIHAHELAELACEIEIAILKEPIGKQDQYISAFGGITEFNFRKTGEVEVNPLPISQTTMLDLEDNLLLFFTNISRSASKILADQNSKSLKNNKEMIENLDFIKDIAFRTKKVLVDGNCRALGELFNEHWEYKKNRSVGMSTKKIDEWYSIAIKNGAVGGKLVGAGGGGFLMFYAEDKNKLRTEMSRNGLQEMRFSFDFEGTKVVHS